MMESLTSLFNLAGSIGYYAAWIGTVTTVAGLGYVGVFKGPRQLTPENGTARVITARRWPKVWHKDKIVAREGPEMYVKWGASKVSDIPLETYRVPVTRSGKDESLILKDKVKARVEAEFFVRVNSENTNSIVQAMEAFSGEINKQKIVDYCTPKFDAALREAAAELDVEQIQTDREQFRNAVKKGLKSLENDGLILIDVALRQLDQAPLEDFDPTSYYDAQGLEKVVERTETSRIRVNDKKQEAETAIEKRKKDENVQRYAIQQADKEAELDKDEQIKKAEADNRENIARYDASSRQAAEAARIAADREVDLQQVNKDQDIAVAKEKQQQATEQARIDREKSVELSKADKVIALQHKNIEESEAQKFAAEKRAEAVKAEESVETAREVEITERSKRIAIIEAETISEAELIDADTKKKASIMAAEGVYASISKQMLATAEGQKALFDAVNDLDEEGQKYLLEKARVEITPEAIREAMKGVEKIGDMRVVSMGGAFNSSASGPDGQMSFPGMGGNGSLAEQVASALMVTKMYGPLLDQMSGTFGGDTKLGQNIPGTPTEKSAPKAEPVVTAENLTGPAEQKKRSASPPDMKPQ